jgi:pyridoxamine 5'-phosphate oxidase
MTVDFSELRREYRHATLDEADVDPCPFRQFDAWFREVVDLGLELPNAMVLATCGADGQPSARYVLLKDYGMEGFVFYSHSSSLKGRQLAENPRAALLFYWELVHRQVRIEGSVEEMPAAEAAPYFATRPYGARLSACAAPQSAVVRDRAFLEARRDELDRQYRGGEVPPPESWRGFRVQPVSMEFWQGREDRLHDRIVYTRSAAGGWSIRRLAP